MSPTAPNGEHAFVLRGGLTYAALGEGLWEEFQSGPQRRSQVAADRVSYAWDSLVESFNTHILAGTQYARSHPDVAENERITRWLARENRLRRRILATALQGLLERTPRDRSDARVVYPSRAGDPYYVFVVAPRGQFEDAAYRQARETMLMAYCRAVKARFPDATDIIGIATESDIDADSTEDAIYLDARDWSPTDQAEASQLAREMNLLQSVKETRRTVYEYPSEEERARGIPTPRHGIRMKGAHRNLPCPCGSGRKMKRCCGR